MPDSKLILIVDDETLNLELLVELLQEAGYRTNYAENGEQALNMYAESKPDLILLDVMLPFMDGYATCQRLRELEEMEDFKVPVIYLSAKVTLEDKLKGYAAGGDDYVTKPFDNAELVAKISNTLQKAQQIQELQANARQVKAMTFSLMTYSSKIGSIGRFLQDSLNCKDIEQLIRCFFDLTECFSLACTLKLRWRNELIVRSHDGIERPLDNEIIKSFANGEKIIPFGSNRALFNWGEVKLLVRNVGDDADSIAIMMDGLLSAYRSIGTYDNLLGNIAEFREKNKQLVVQSAKIVEDLHEELCSMLDKFGCGTSLNEHEEQAIAGIVSRYRQHLDLIVDDAQKLEPLLDLALKAFKG